MTTFIFAAAELIPRELVPKGGWLTPTGRQALIILGTCILVGLALAAWAALYYSRRRHRHHHHHHRHHHHDHTEEWAPQPEENPAVEDAERHRTRRRRRRRRDHRPRNPTLAETGGLPPARTEQPPNSLP